MSAQGLDLASYTQVVEHASATRMRKEITTLSSPPTPASSAMRTE